MCIVYCRSIAAIICLGVILAAPAIRAESSGPQAVIQGFNAALLESMRGGDALGYNGRYNLLAPVIKKSFALAFMAKKSVGIHWKKLDREQRRRFVDTYTNWSVAHYANNFDDYSGQRFEMLPGAEKVGKTVTIVSQLVGSDGEAVDFFYKLRNHADNWRIVDIHIEGVSQLALTRGQFVGVIKRDGFEALIAKLTKKIAAFSKKSGS